METSVERPKKPGWYWYVDSNYGPAPVYLDWASTPEDRTSQELVVDASTDWTFNFVLVSDLDGLWAPLEVPAPMQLEGESK